MSEKAAEGSSLLTENPDIPFGDTRHWNVEFTFDCVHFTEAEHHSFAENPRKELRL